MGNKIINGENFDVSMIRNFSIISHVDHGKTTLSDHLISMGGLLPSLMAGKLKALDYLKEEQKRGITIKSALTTFELIYDKNKYLINLIDTPGHIDFSAKVAESLRMVDNGLILVDAVEGVMAQTRTVLSQAIKENLNLVLFINKIDRLITEMQLTREEIKRRVERIVGEISSIVASEGGKSYPNFANGTIILGSALHGWGMDNLYVQQGGNIDDIIEKYPNLKSIPDAIKLRTILGRMLVEKFINPQEGQIKKFPNLLANDLDNQYIELLHNTSSSQNLILLIGQNYRNEKKKKIGNIIRVLSGKLELNDKVYSSISGDKISVNKIVQFRGKTEIPTSQLYVGNLGGAILDPQVSIGDVLCFQQDIKILMKGISYVQDPVVTVSIEPKEINQIDDLQSVLEEITEISPSLNYQINKETGEFLINGVGTLQLDIVVEELKERGIEIQKSDPITIKYAIPTESASFETSWGKVFCCNSNQISDEDMDEASYSDNHDNYLIIEGLNNTEFINGVKTTFKRFTRLSPIHNERIKNLMVKIIVDSNLEIDLTYENGLITSSTVMKRAISLAKTIVHEPYYSIEVNVPHEFLGNAINELNRLQSMINEVYSEGSKTKITAELPVSKSFNFSETIRRVTNGNAFWSYRNIIFYKEN